MENSTSYLEYIREIASMGKPICYTTGASISPHQIKIDYGTGERNVWVWVVDSFESDTYYDGKYIEVSAVADEADVLIVKEND